MDELIENPTPSIRQINEGEIACSIMIMERLQEYLRGAQIALREGDMARAQEYALKYRERFSDLYSHHALKCS